MQRACFRLAAEDCAQFLFRMGDKIKLQCSGNAVSQINQLCFREKVSELFLCDSLKQPCDLQFCGQSFFCCVDVSLLVKDGLTALQGTDIEHQCDIKVVISRKIKPENIEDRLQIPGSDGKNIRAEISGRRGIA